MLIMIAAKSRDTGAIGYKNTLPWKQSEDLRRFKTLTIGRTIMMGRSTFESIGSKPLPGRKNIVVSSSKPEIEIPEVTWVTINEAEQLVASEDTLVIIGGEKLYQHFIGLADIMYITDIYTDASLRGDAFFPEIPVNDWTSERSAIHPADEKNQFPYRFIEYTRI